MSIDASTGNIYEGQIATVASTENANFKRFMSWADEARQMKVMTNACDTLRKKLVEGVTANTERCKDYVMNSIGIVTLLKPHFGYQKCAAIAKEGYTTGKSLHQIVVDEQHLMTQAEWDATFNTQNLIHPKFVK